MSGILAPVGVIINLLIATGISFLASFMWTDMPSWGVLFLGTVIFSIGLYLQDVFARSKSQREVFETLKNLTTTQEKLLSQVTEIQGRQPGVALSGADENDPQSMSKAVLAEIQFMRSLIHQISDYHEKVAAQKPAPQQKTAPQAVKTPDSEVVEPHLEEVGGTKELSREDLLTALQGALKSDRIEMLLQPIVSLPQRKRRHVECFSRIKDVDGSIIVPDNYIKIAQDESLISIIDNTLIFRCVQLLRKVLKKSQTMNFFCNISTYSLKSEKFIDGLLEFFSANGELSQHIIFEIDYYNLKQDMDEVSPTIEKLAQKNCHFSLDKIESLEELDIKHLKKCNFKFIKIESQFLLNLLAQKGGEKKLKAFKKKTDKADIDIIFTKVEEEKQLLEVLDLNIDFGQGYLFGAPKLSSY